MPVPFLEQIVENGVQLFLLGGIPWLGEVVVDAGSVDGLDRSIRISVSR